MDVDYELSQQLQAHESQVRCLAVLTDGTIVSGGLDAQIAMWKRPSPGEPYALHKKLGHHSDFIYDLTPSHDIPGAFYSASKDRTAVRIDAEGNPVQQYVGHEGPVCSVLERGAQVITGSWDGTAKVWDVSSGELQHSLDAGAHAVTIGVLPTGEIVTGSQDRTLRVFRGEECTHTVPNAHEDIIRSISVSSTHLISGSNDNLIKMWSFDGCEMAKLEGHQSFVYGVTHSHDSKTLLSSSDDSTLKLWSLEKMQCNQSIVHAGTVWQAVALPNGDFVTACADMIVRVWTQDPERMAEEAERTTQKEMAEQAHLQAAQKGSSSVPTDTAIDISKMPTTVGKKNGEIKCFKEGSKVNAYSWNADTKSWDCIGEVVGSQSEKVFYPGDTVFPKGEYDFVWDVDMGPSHGMAKLPFNKGQNPMAVAEGFMGREQIDKGNMDQIRQFILQNAGADGIGFNPIGSASQEKAAPAAAEAVSSMFPIQSYTQFKDGKYEPLLKKLLEFNEQVDEGLRMDSQEILYLTGAIDKLKSGAMKDLRACEKDVIHAKLGKWPNDKLFPVIDLWRLYLNHPQCCDYFKGSDRGQPFITQVLNLLASDPNGALGMCSSRYIANLFQFQTNRYALFDKRVAVLRNVDASLGSTNKHTRVACVTVLLNLAICIHEVSFPPKAWDSECAAEVTRLVLSFLERAGADDGDAQQRCAYTLGTLLVRDMENGGENAKRLKEALLPKLGAMESKIGAPVVAELRKMLA